MGLKPESITKGFQDNYYVTIMNGKENSDGELVEISEAGVKVFEKGFDEPKSIAYLKRHFYFSDLIRIWRVDNNGKASVFVDKTDFPEEMPYIYDVAVGAEDKGIYVADMGATKYMCDDTNALWPLDSEETKSIPRAGRIYHIDLKCEISIVQDTSPLMLDPNGMDVENNGDIVVGTFFIGNFL